MQPTNINLAEIPCRIKPSHDSTLLLFLHCTRWWNYFWHVRRPLNTFLARNIAVSGLTEHCPIFHFPPSSVRSSVTGVTSHFSSIIWWFRPWDHKQCTPQPIKSQCSPVQSGKVKYSPAQPSTAQHSPVQPSIAQHRPVQACKVQCSPLQSTRAKNSSVQASTAQYSPLQSIRAQYSPVAAQYIPVQPVITLLSSHLLTSLLSQKLHSLLCRVFLISQYVTLIKLIVQ